MNMITNALFSSCGKYRYTLSRLWNRDKSCILFIMLNPSTADAQKDDPTIRRCIKFAQSWGYGGLLVGNIFALRSTDPKELYRVDDPVGKENDYYLYLQAQLSCDGNVVCAWGNHGAHKQRGKEVVALLKSWGIHPRCFGLTKAGEPRHPLYLKKSAELIEVPHED